MKFTLRSLFIDTAVVAVLLVLAREASNPIAFTVFMSLEYLALKFCITPQT